MAVKVLVNLYTVHTVACYTIGQNGLSIMGEYKENGIITFITYCIYHIPECFIICLGITYILYYTWAFLVWLLELIGLM